jgi:hypothetical protein
MRRGGGNRFFYINQAQTPVVFLLLPDPNEYCKAKTTQ